MRVGDTHDIAVANERVKVQRRFALRAKTPDEYQHSDHDAHKSVSPGPSVVLDQKSGYDNTLSIECKKSCMHETGRRVLPREPSVSAMM